MNGVVIHPTAVVDPGAKLGEGVTIGPYAVIGERVEIGDQTQILHHATISGFTRIGRECKIFPFSSLGSDPQDVTFKGEPTTVEIGDQNIIREFNTINRGTVKGGGVTRIGNRNYFMAYVHVAHDCQIGSRVIMTNGATLAGHVVVEDAAVVGAFSSVHQFVRIGKHAYIGGYSIVLQDILPFARVSQKRESFSLYGPNSIGMMRSGFSRATIESVKEVFRTIFHTDLNTSQAVLRITEEMGDQEEARAIVDFIAKSKRGILKKFVTDE